LDIKNIIFIFASVITNKINYIMKKGFIIGVISFIISVITNDFLLLTIGCGIGSLCIANKLDKISYKANK
jgi:hypothetical protein